jgi:hypothetical protein
MVGVLKVFEVFEDQGEALALVHLTRAGRRRNFALDCCNGVGRQEIANAAPTVFPAQLGSLFHLSYCSVAGFVFLLAAGLVVFLVPPRLIRVKESAALNGNSRADC